MKKTTTLNTKLTGVLALSLVMLILLVPGSLSAQSDTPQPPTPGSSLVIQADALVTAPLVSNDLLAPGCELVSAEAGVYQVICDEDPGTSGIPTIDGELLAEGCELTHPEAGVFILDCGTESMEPVPMSSAPLTILPGVQGIIPSNVAPAPDACANAAGSYMEPGMEAIRSTLISFDDIVYSNQDEVLVEFALHALDATQLLGARNRFTSPSELDAVGPFNDGDIVTIGELDACFNVDGFTLRLWQLDNSEWVIDTITSNQAIDLTSAWPDDTPDPQNPGQMLDAPENPVLVDGVLFRYLLPYVEPPVTTVPGANQFDSGGSACEGTPSSYLSIGMNVILDGYGYQQFPQSYDVPYRDWTFDNTHFELSQHGFDTYVDILNTTPLTNIVGNLESVAVTPQELYSGVRPEAVVLDGPFCIEESVDPPLTDGGPIAEAADPAPDRFSLWWEIDINGQVGYYPENVGQYSWWLWDFGEGFPRKLSLYYMIPNEQLTQAASCPPVGLFAGQVVQPGVGAMNLRAVPNGDIIGRAETGQPVNIFGEPTCEGGANWWQTDRGGFIAENDPESGLPLLVPYVPPTVEPTTQPNPAVTAEPVQPDPVVTEVPTSEPERPTEVPTSEPERPTEVPPREPERPTEAPSIDEIAPIEVEPTRPPRAG